MRKILFSLLILAATLSACSKSSLFDDNNNNSGGSSQDPQLSSGQWKVTWYYDKDKEETSKFSGYSFDFQSGGTLVAHLPGGSTQSGTWSITSSKLIITIAGTDALNDMTDDWLLLEKTDSLIRLQDDNSEHLEALHLEK